MVQLIESICAAIVKAGLKRLRRGPQGDHQAAQHQVDLVPACHVGHQDRGVALARPSNGIAPRSESFAACAFGPDDLAWYIGFAVSNAHARAERFTGIEVCLACELPRLRRQERKLVATSVLTEVSSWLKDGGYPVHAVVGSKKGIEIYCDWRIPITEAHDIAVRLADAQLTVAVTVYGLIPFGPSPPLMESTNECAQNGPPGPEGPLEGDAGTAAPKRHHADAPDQPPTPPPGRP